METDLKKWIIITGPTASGKTRLAAQVAVTIGGEIISIDSRQIFRHMDLGTGKDYDDYHINGVDVPYHLIDLKEPGEEYHLYQFQQDFNACLKKINQKKRVPVLCGGSGLYLEAVLENHQFTSIPSNPDFRSTLENRQKDVLVDQYKKGKPLPYHVDKNSTKRLIRALEIQVYLTQYPFPDRLSKPPEYALFILTLSRESRRQKISQRLHQRLENGLVREVELLLSKVNKDVLIRYGLEYKYITHYLLGLYSYEEMVIKLETGIHRFAKRQMTWFRRMERKGYDVNWLDGEKEIHELTSEILEE